MDIQHVREFLMFAKYLNFSQAAKHLHVSQPTLSQHVQALERELGTPLVMRDGPLALTSAGRLLWERGQDWVELHDSIVEDCRAVRQRQTTMRVPQILDLFPLGQLLGAAIHRTDETGDGVHYAIALVPCGTLTTEEMLAEGLIDLGFVFKPHQEGPEPDDNANSPFQRARVAVEEQYAAMYRDHPLALFDPLPLKALDGASFVTTSPAILDSFRSAIVQMAEREGIRMVPKLCTVTNVMDSPNICAPENISIHGNHLFEAINRTWPTDAYVCRSIVDPGLFVDIVAVWRRDANLDVLHFAEALRSVAQSERTP